MKESNKLFYTGTRDDLISKDIVHAVTAIHKQKRASADTQTGHRQRLFVGFTGIRISAGIGTYSRSITETARGI